MEFEFLRFCAVAAVIATGGILGSYTRSVLEREKEADLRQIVVPGLAAAFVVPLFIDISQSQLIGETLDPAKAVSGGNLLIIFAFCVLAGASAKSFIGRLSERVFSEIEAVRQQAAAKNATVEALSVEMADARELIEEAVGRQVPVDGLSGRPQGAFSSEVGGGGADPTRRVLAALGDEPRPIARLARITGLGRAQAAVAVDQLVSAGAVEPVPTDHPSVTFYRAVRAVIPPAGRDPQPGAFAET